MWAICPNPAAWVRMLNKSIDAGCKISPRYAFFDIRIVQQFTGVDLPEPGNRFEDILPLGKLQSQPGVLLHQQNGGAQFVDLLKASNMSSMSRGASPMEGSSRSIIWCPTYILCQRPAFAAHRRTGCLPAAAAFFQPGKQVNTHFRSASIWSLSFLAKQASVRFSVTVRRFENYGGLPAHGRSRF